MLEVSEEAIKRLGDVGGPEKAGVPIRIAVMGSGATNCGLGLMTDEAKETDTVFSAGNHSIVVDKSLMDYCVKIRIDFTKGEPERCDSRSKRGFLISADNPVNF